MDPLYYKTYEQAQIRLDDGTTANGYNVIEMKWYQDPRYNKDLQWRYINKETGDETIIDELEFTHDHFDEMIQGGYKPTSSWYREMCKTMNYDSRRIAQELDVSFLGSGGNVIDDEYIQIHELENVREPKFVDDKYSDGNSGQVWIWEEPEEGHEYIASVDVARGDGADYSTMIIVDFTTMEQVMEYQGKIPPDLLAEIAYDYGMRYNAYMVVDIIGVGVTTVLKLVEMKYPNLHYDKVRTSAFIKKSDYTTYAKNNLNNLGHYTKDNKLPGFNVNGVRLQLISNLEQKVRLNEITIRSKRLCMEMKTFVYKNGKPDHMEGYHDDLLMSLGMILWIMEYSFKNLKKLEGKSKAMLAGWVANNGSNIQTNGYTPKSQINTKGTNAKAPTYLNNNNANKNIANGNHMWLFSGYR